MSQCGPTAAASELHDRACSPRALDELRQGADSASPSGHPTARRPPRG
eukprot:CAMPEP_0197896808 /NCGR_PEP_ID=MMETSP1439-20131203/40853_1 /TAXON_ID=66791 /ORGANISM="Gonyaulax spinifera, Strain CCMP409" /LENGTH=47 /DNA_ID= /DNA_START= /DNA_END= /DNA_ORIENTATION=